jgi:GAF domain-containing protein
LDTLPRSAVIANANHDLNERRDSTLEQAALRRIATLVAQGVQPHELFAVVAEEVGRVVDAPSVAVARYESDATATACATFGPQGPLFRTGTRVSLEGANVLSLVRESAEPARIDDYTGLEGEIADAVRLNGMCSSVGVPIVVAGRLWGAIVTSGTERLPENTGARLVELTELLAVAIANTEAREALTRLAEEQAALRRVATLVAQDAAPAEIFAAVSAEVDRVFGLDPATSDVAVVGRFEPGPELVVVGLSKSVEVVPLGSRWPPDELFAPTHVLRTGRSARTRADDLVPAGGEVADFLRHHGYLSQVASPIVVEGRLWGAMSVNTRIDLPPDTEERLERFTELVATAIANAESRETLAQLAHEQAALRRVATLVAEGAAPADVFAAVAWEVAQLFDLAVTLSRYEDDAVVVVGDPQDSGFPVGSRWPFDGDSLSLRVRATGRMARIDDYSGIEGSAGARMRELDSRSAVGAPIVVEGGLWGILCVGAATPQLLTADVEARIAGFVELVGTAIANSQARDGLRLLADEQAALRRVATLVAEGAPPDALFRAVADEVASVVGPPTVTLSHHHADGSFTVVAATNNPGFPVGSRWPLEGPSLAATIHETGRAARIDDYSTLGGAVAAAMYDSSMRAAAGAPIVVDGKVWGHISVAAKGTETLPAGTEQRLLDFTELLATAISNAESRDAIARLAEAQAALRRVATLVAEGAAPGELFNAVAWEVGQLFDFAAVTLNRYEDDAVVVLADPLDSGFPVGSRWPFDGDSLAVRVHATRQMARIDDYSDIESSAATRMRERASWSAIGVPVFVEGDLWGLLCVGAAATQLLPTDTGDRIAGFVELVGTAISNGQARDRLRLLAEEQAALRRVATLVARDAPSTEVFAAVATEVGNLLDTDITVVGRYDGDGAATAIGSWSASPGGVPVGTRSVLGGRNVLTLVAETQRPARVDGYDDAWGEAAEIARRHSWRSSIAAPIIVEDRLWGVMLVATRRPEPFPAGAEERLAGFTDLVATALANAQAHDEVRRFGEEQAALGRVATLVAAGAAPEQVFTAVVDEASSLLGLERIAFVRYNGSHTGTVIAASGEHPFVPGSTWSLEHPSIMATVARTTRAARIDDYGALKGEIARAARRAGFRSAIGAPLTVEGHLWGVIIGISTDPEPIPERSEARLGQFTELVATAVANAEARQALERVAAEQATLRRIATLVARGVRPEELFAAVAEETATTFDAITGIARFEHDPPGVVLVGVSKDADLPLGMRWDFAEGMSSAEVYRTGRPARFNPPADHWSSLSGPPAEAGHRLGIVSQVSCPIVVEGGVWGVITVNGREELPPDTEQRLEKFTDLVTTAIANAEGKSELAASRRRIVAAADEARRRIERDLHDGIQQRLIALTFRARAMTRKPPDELPGLAAELSEGLKDASDELREVARGIHPTILTEAGLRPALRALARRSEIPIEVDVSLDERLPAPIEAAAYYIASEALTNVAKHAHANVVQLTAAHDNGALTLEVRDDGIGGVDAGRGSGILGLTDRVEALGGTISISSPPRGGTTLSVHLPITA